MEKLPITLCIITRNSEDRIEKVINKHKDFVSQILVVDQESEDSTAQRAEGAGAFVITRRVKGTSDPDRNWLFNMADYEWVLYLDDDEYIDVQDYNELKKIMQIGVDAIWFKRTNLVDGVDIGKVLGEDLQCRLFKKGATNWADAIHTYPKCAEGVKVLFTEIPMIHERTLEGLKASNRGRNAIASPEQIKTQEGFIKQVEEVLAKETV